MSVDMAQLAQIHHLQGEVSEADREVKALVEEYEQKLADLPEQQAVDEAEQALKEARDGSKSPSPPTPTSPSWLIGSMRPNSTGATWERSCRTTWSSTTTNRPGRDQGPRGYDSRYRVQSQARQTCTRPATPTAGWPRQVPGAALPNPRGCEGGGEAGRGGAV